MNTWRRGASREAVDSRRPLDDVTHGVRVAAWWSLCFLLVAGAVVVLCWLLAKIGLVTVTVAVAIMLAAMLQPFVGALHRHGMPRGLAATLVFVVGILVFGVLVWFVVGQIIGAGTDLANQLDDTAASVQHWLVHGPLHVDAADAGRYTTNLDDTIRDNTDLIRDRVRSTASSALAIASSAVLCMFATLFLLLDDGRIWRWVTGLFPRHVRPQVGRAGVAAWRTLTVYMRSLVLLAALNALAMVPVMMIAGMPLVVPLAVLLFLGSLVPMIGVIVAGVIVAMIALVTQGVTTALVVTIALVVIVQLFGNLLNPIILGKFVSIHPLAILVTVTAGTLVAGIFGAFVAVPLVAVINNAVKVIRNPRDTDALADGGAA